MIQDSTYSDTTIVPSVFFLDTVHPQNSLEADTSVSHDSLQYGITDQIAIPTKGYTPIQEIKKTTIISTPREKQPQHWITLIILFCVILVGFTKAFNSNRFQQVTKSLFSFVTASEIVREEKVFFHRANLLLSSVYLMVSSLFIYKLELNYLPLGLFTYFKILTFLLLSYVIKYSVTRLVAHIFEQQILASHYIFGITSFNNLLGVLLIPVLLLIYFTSFPPLFIINYITLPLFIFILILRWFRLFVIGQSKSVSYVYIFLYICSLEILPLVVIVKVFILS